MGKELIPAKSEVSSGILSTFKSNEWSKDFDNNDLQVSIIYLLQGLSKEVTQGSGKMGQMMDSKTHEIIGDINNPVEIVILKKGNGAIYFPKDEKGKPILGAKPICGSDNGITSRKGDTCSDCPFGQYWAKKWGAEGPPHCAGTKTFVVIERGKLISGDAYPFMFSFTKTSYSAGKNLAGISNRYPMMNLPIFGRSFSIKSFIDKNQSGTFANYDVAVGTPLNNEELTAAHEWYSRVNGSNIVTEESEPTFGDDDI